MQNKLPNEATLRKENSTTQECEVIAVTISQFNEESLAWASNQSDLEMDNNELSNQQEVLSDMDKENLVTSNQQQQAESQLTTHQTTSSLDLE